MHLGVWHCRLQDKGFQATQRRRRGGGGGGWQRAGCAPASHDFIEQRRDLTDGVVASGPPAAVAALPARRVAESGRRVRTGAGGSVPAWGTNAAGAVPAWAQALRKALRRDDDVAVRAPVFVPTRLGLVWHAPAVQRQQQRPSGGVRLVAGRHADPVRRCEAVRMEDTQLRAPGVRRRRATAASAVAPRAGVTAHAGEPGAPSARRHESATERMGREIRNRGRTKLTGQAKRRAPQNYATHYAHPH